MEKKQKDKRKLTVLKTLKKKFKFKKNLKIKF